MDRLHLNLSDPLEASASRPTSMNLPVAVHRRLDEMARLAHVVRATRNEILAALIAFGELDPGRLEQMVLDYRRLTVGDVLPVGDHDGESVVVALRKPGRPRSTG